MYHLKITNEISGEEILLAEISEEQLRDVKRMFGQEEPHYQELHPGLR